MLNALTHRGPDGEGTLIIPADRPPYLRLPDDRGDYGGAKGCLLHRRLSIVDLQYGAQPLANEDGTVWVTYNGEIYNHEDLRRQLVAAGHHFKTRADTEVLVHGWEEWRTELFAKLNGIFAIALYDARQDGGLWLVRDPLGVKPLYVGRSMGGWWFASELRAAMTADLDLGGLRPDAFNEFLVYRFVPSPGTFFKDAWKVPPGHWCRLDAESSENTPTFEEFTYRSSWTPPPPSRASWAETLRSGIRDAVTRQLMSDVPVASLLSGGIDSTVITSVMQERMADPPVAFGIGFSNATDVDELSEARYAAAALGVSLVETGVDEADYLQEWPLQIGSLGEPIANSSALMLGLLCRQVAKTHKVVLCGQGADEPLGGYPRHIVERWYSVLRPFRWGLRLLPEASLASDRLQRLERILSESDEARRFAQTLAVFGLREAASAGRHGCEEDALAEPTRRWLRRAPDESPLNRLLYVDARLSLADDLLIIADHMAMASSVELRVPFLDLDFLSTVERMPSALKVSVFGERKWFYRESVAPLIPPALRERLAGIRARTGRKLGFSTPLDRWFVSWSQSDAGEFLLGRDACLPSFIRPEFLASFLGSAREQRLPRARQMMGLFVLESWLRSHNSFAHQETSLHAV